jgi:hypothetical protein
VVLVVDLVDVIALIMIHHLVGVMEVLVFSEEIHLLVVEEVVHGIVMVDMVEVVVEEDLQEFIVLVLVYQDKVIMEEALQNSGVVPEEAEGVVSEEIWMRLVEEEVYVLIFQVMDSPNLVHKREEVLVEQTGIFKTHHSQVENMVDMEEVVVVPIAVFLQEVTRMRVLIEDKVVEVKVIVPAEGLEMEVLVLFK